MTVDATRVIAELRALDERSGGERVAWTEICERERTGFADALRAEVPAVQYDRDEAGNAWFVLPGVGPAAARTVVVGSHLDCVPGGGWLDGCLGVLAGAEVLRAAARIEERATLMLVDWADEEGARFGHSLLGSSAVCGLFDYGRAAQLVDEDGVTLPVALAAHGVDIERMAEARSRIDGLDAYVELHIEQGPVLDEAELPASAVDGCLGVRRHELRFTGQAVHAGATPMRLRHDPVQALAIFAGELRALAVEHDGLATIGTLRAEPQTPTAVPGQVRLSTDIRHHTLDGLESLQAAAEHAAEAAATAAGCTLHSQELWSIDPIHFDTALVERAASLVPEGTTLTSGPLHDAAAVSRAGVPTVMVFARTSGGVSHSREEDARDEDLVVAIDAFGTLVAGLLVQGSAT